MSDFYNEELTAKYAAPAAMPRKSFISRLINWGKAHTSHFGGILIGIGILMMVWSLCSIVSGFIQFALEGRMTVDAGEIASERCLHQDGIDMVIVGQYVFECQSEESHE